MRGKRLLPVAVIALSAGAALMFLASRYSARPVISIGILGYTNSWNGPSIRARVGLANTGRVTIKLNQMNFSHDAWVRIESPSGWNPRVALGHRSSGWVSWDIGPFAVTPLMPTLLKPGSSTSVTVLLRRHFTLAGWV